MQKGNDWVDELKSKNDIIDVISYYLPLTQKGRTYWGVCPFHHDKNPSMCVNREEQFYHCFACKESGDVIKFVEKIENVDFMDACEILAKRCHFEIPVSSGDIDALYALKQKKNRLYDLMRDAARAYHENLMQPAAAVANDYLKRRGVSSEMIVTFGLGYSLGWEELIRTLLAKKYTEKEMLEAGVAEERNGKLFDALHGRLIFPIINNFGQVVAFGGRLLEQADFAKYKNTKETLIFEKNSNLYAINLLKKFKQSNPLHEIILVEGYMDVIGLYQAGIKNVIASMGTALTINQIKMLKRYADKVVVSYDGDSAGKKATMRGLELLKSEAIGVRIAEMPEGMDPDETVKNRGVKGYLDILSSALPITDYKLKTAAAAFDLAQPAQRSAFLAQAVAILQQSEKSEQAVYAKVIAQKALVSEQAVIEMIGGRGKENISKASKSEAPILKPEVENMANLRTGRSILWALLYKRVKADLSYIGNLLENEEQRAVILCMQQAGDDFKIGDIMQNLKGNKEFEEVLNMKQEINQVYFEDCLRQLSRESLNKRIDALIPDYEREIDIEKRNAIAAEIKRLSGELSKLGGSNG